jgi:hypothetical protein
MTMNGNYVEPKIKVHFIQISKKKLFTIRFNSFTRHVNSKLKNLKFSRCSMLLSDDYPKYESLTLLNL